MIRKEFPLLTIIAAAFFLVVLSCEKEEIENSPPVYNRDNPHLAKVGDFIIDHDFFKSSLHLAPPSIFERFANPENFRDFLKELVTQEIYYQEGKFRKYDAKPLYAKNVSSGKRIALIEYSLEIDVKRNSPVTGEEVREFYDSHRDLFKGLKGKALPFVNVELKIERRLLRQKMEEQMNISGKKLEDLYGVEYDFSLFSPEHEKSSKSLVKSGVVTWSPADFFQKAINENIDLRKMSFEKKRKTLIRMVREILFYSNALADQLDKDEEFSTRIDILKRYILASYTKGRIMGSDVKIKNSQARAFYDLNPDRFIDKNGDIPAFNQVKERAVELAAIEYRNHVFSNLADALARDRFEREVFTWNLDKMWGPVVEH